MCVRHRSAHEGRASDSRGPGGVRAGGPTAAAAFEEAAIAMFDYMTPLDYVEEEDGVIATGEVKGPW